ncbi:hypothetical protein C8Q80DRAFT_738924 [Daedaleopsis nitida]|nr:hypothetical protein C8Q80DRAFT_738924 [Daedaleopsis nitida]
MTTTRAPVPPVDLKARIAALQQQQAANAQAAQANSTSQTLPKANAVAGPNAFRDRIASFEKQGAVPKPMGRFGFAPPMQTNPANAKRSGELYGNRVPGLSRPHIPVPPTSKADKKQSRSRSQNRSELDRYATSPSPPGSPFIMSDNGDSVGDVLSDDDPNSPNYPMSLEESQQLSLDAIVASKDGEVEEVAEVSFEAPPDTDAVTTSGNMELDQQGGSPAIVVSPSEPEPEEVVPVVAFDVASSVLQLPTELAPAEPEPSPPVVKRSHTPPTIVEPVPIPPLAQEPTPSKPSEDIDPDVQAVIEQLDRATRLGDSGNVVVPAATLEALASLGGGTPEQEKSSVQDMLDQLLSEQDILDIATPIKQRFSLNGSLSQLAVRNFLVQQSELAAKETRAVETPVKKDARTADAPSSGHYLSPSAYSPDSPGSEPLSPASDIYSSYLLATPAVPFGRALPAIPEAPDSPIAIKDPRRDTFGKESNGSTAPSSPPLATPSDDGRASISPSDGAIKLPVNLVRVTSPPLSVVIPRTGTPKAKQKEEHPPSPHDAVIVSDPQRIVSPTVIRGVLVPAPQSASSSSSSPSSSYSVSVYSEGTSPSPSGAIGRKVSSKHKKQPISPPTSAPYDEPILTPIEGPRGFRAVVHEKVVEGKSRPVSMAMQQYDDLPSPTPMNAAHMSDLASLLADAAMLEKQLADSRTPQKKLPSRPGTAPPSRPPPEARQGTPDRPLPTQDLPESPDDMELFGRMSQDQSGTSRDSRYESSRKSQYEHRPLPARPSLDRTLTRPSDYLERVPSRPSMERSQSARPSTDSTSSSRPQLQPMFLTADPNAVRIPLPARPKSAAGSRTSTSTPPAADPKSLPRAGYLSNLLSRAKSSGNLRSDPRDSVGSSSEDSVMVSTPPTPPYEITAVDTTGSVRNSRMFKNSISRATNFADRLLHRKDGSTQSADVAIVSGDEDDQVAGSRVLPRPPRPLPLPPRPLPPRGLPPPVPLPASRRPTATLRRSLLLDSLACSAVAPGSPSPACQQQASAML